MTTEYPAELPHRSIRDGLPIGTIRDDSPTPDKLASVQVTENLLIAGLVRSGTTNTLLGITAGLLQCTDPVLWGVDLGGRTLARFLEPFLAQDTDRPVIDWLAITPPEAIRLLDAAAEVIAHRYHDEQPADGWTPLVLLVTVDSMTGSDAGGLDATLTRIQRLGPDVNVTVVRESKQLGYDLTTGSVDAFGAVIMHRPDRRDQNALALAFGADYPVDQLRLEWVDAPGGAAYRPAKRQPVALMDSFLTAVDRIDHIVQATTDRRTHLDTGSAEAAGGAYTDRWARMHVATNGRKTDRRQALDVYIREQITAARTAGQRIVDLYEAALRDGYTATINDVETIVEGHIAAGVVVRDPKNRNRFLDPSLRMPRPLLTVYLPISQMALATMLSALGAEVAGRDGSRELTTDHWQYIVTPDGQALVVYDLPVRPLTPADRPPWRGFGATS